MTGPGDMVEAYQQRRRTAARRVLLVLLVGIGVQVGVLVVAAGHPALDAAVILAVMVAMSVGAAMLVPAPAGGFVWAWQRAARERQAAARARRTSPTSPYEGFDLFFFATVMVGVLPYQVFNSWLESRELDLTTELVWALVVAVCSVGIFFGVLEVRRRLARAAAARPDSSSGSSRPGTVVLQRRPEREHGHDTT